MNRILLSFIFALVLIPGLSAQADTVSAIETSFRKGRSLVGLDGAISSSFISKPDATTNPTQQGNRYRFDIRLGKFIADKNMLGLIMMARRTHTVGYVDTKTEVLGIGPWYRLYVGKIPNIAFYAETSLLYSNYYGRSKGVVAYTNVDETLDLQGAWGALGIGVSYVMGDRVSFDVGCEYNKSRYWGTSYDGVLDVEQDIILDRAEFVFHFGFYILFEKLKRDD